MAREVKLNDLHTALTGKEMNLSNWSNIIASTDKPTHVPEHYYTTCEAERSILA